MAYLPSNAENAMAFIAVGNPIGLGTPLEIHLHTHLPNAARQSYSSDNS